MKVRISGRKYPRRNYWKEQRLLALTRSKKLCEVTGDRHGPTVDHLLPERFVRRYLVGSDPHHLSNLIVLNHSEHGFKTGVDRLLWKGPDFLGFINKLYGRGWPMQRVEAAFKHYGLHYGGPR